MAVKVAHGCSPGQLVKVRDRAVPPVFEMEHDRQDGTPVLVLGFEVRDGVPQCRRAELRSTADGREVLSSDLRGVKIEDRLEVAFLLLAMEITEQVQVGGVLTKMSPIMTQEGNRKTLAQVRGVRQEARRRVTDELLREVAEVYRANVEGNPTAAVARHTGRAHRTAALYVQQARDAGYLGASIRGKAGEQA